MLGYYDYDLSRSLFNFSFSDSCKYMLSSMYFTVHVFSTDTSSDSCVANLDSATWRIGGARRNQWLDPCKYSNTIGCTASNLVTFHHFSEHGTDSLLEEKSFSLEQEEELQVIAAPDNVEVMFMVRSYIVNQLCLSIDPSHSSAGLYCKWASLQKQQTTCSLIPS